MSAGVSNMIKPEQAASARAMLAAARDTAKLEPSARHWRQENINNQVDSLRYSLSTAACTRIHDAISFARQNGLTKLTVEQEDFRVPELSQDISHLRQLLDNGPGFVTVRGIPISPYSTDDDTADEDAIEIIAWGVANYLGRPLRQGITTDRRLFSVTDKGSANQDPTRIGATAKRSAMHTDNGCLEPRPPEYIGLLCVQAASQGGESTLMTARTVFATLEKERPDLLPLYFEHYAFRSPQQHVWPSGLPYIHKPIFDVRHGELHVHYARVMIEPGMDMAGTPLNQRQREALDFLDEVLSRDELCYRAKLNPGDLLIMNNLVMLHGREAFTNTNNHTRMLKRIWLRRRHLFAGDDPVALDQEDY